MPHTPGPWTFDYPEDDRCNVQVWSGPNQRVCFLAHDDTRANSTGTANGMLIAAAPDLLEACASVWAYLAGNGDPDLRDLADQCRAAIAKATEQPTS